MVYEPPTLGQLKEVIRRALRDDGTVFPTEMLTDFVNEALADLSVVRPLEYFVRTTFDASLSDTAGINPDDYVDMNYLWQVEAFVANDGPRVVVPYLTPGESNERNGWDFYVHSIFLSRFWFNYFARNFEEGSVLMGLWGYRDHRWPEDDDAFLDLYDAVDYLFLMRCIRMLGFQSLESDRALYQQWIAATNNTDVSPTQLQGMRSQAEQAYERLRKQVQRPKRIPVTGIQYVS